MRRALLLLLAVFLVGWWGERRPAPDLAGRAVAAPELSAPERAATHQLAEPAGVSSRAFLRAGSPLPPVAGHDVSGPRPQSPSGAAQWGMDGAVPTATAAAFAARARRHSEHTHALALLRAGHSAFHTATPPPFRSV